MSLVPAPDSAPTKSSPPVALFPSHIIAGETTGRVFQYDITGDGKRFLVVTSNISGAAAPPLTVWLNWNSGLKR